MSSLPISAFAKSCNSLLAGLNLDDRVTPRTIRYYTQENLLPPPTMEQGQARYNYGHLLRVLVIKFYQTQFIPLRLIRQRLAGKGRAALEQLVTDAVLNRNGVLPANAIAESTLPEEESMISPRQTFATIPPEGTPNIPTNSPEMVLPPLPIVYDDTPSCTEYRVLRRNSLEATRLEADLNALGRKGWRLVQILTQEEQILLVLMRHTRNA